MQKRSMYLPGMLQEPFRFRGFTWRLNHAGFVTSEMRDDHDIVVVNTCGFIDLAKEGSVETILHQVERKKAGEIEKLYVTGAFLGDIAMTLFRTS